MFTETTKAWILDAILDGWTKRPTLPNIPEEDAVTLEKEGFTVMIQHDKMFGWGPDRLGVEVPERYDMKQLTKNLRKCGECNKEDVHVQRVGFAGRVCNDCLSDAIKKYEFPGWTN